MLTQNQRFTVLVRSTGPCAYFKGRSYVGTLGGPMFLHYNYRQVHPKEIPARNLIPILDFGEEILSPVF